MKQPNNNQITTLRAIKGAPLTLLYALVMLGGLGKNKDLEYITGYSDKTIARGLDALRFANLITRSAGHWILTQGGNQMILAGPAQIERVGESPTLAATTAIKESDLTINDSSSSNSENLRLLKGAGIFEPTRSEIANLEHVNPEYLDSHITAWKNDPDPQRRRPGLLITKLRNGDPAPEDEIKDGCPDHGPGLMYNGSCRSSGCNYEI